MTTQLDRREALRLLALGMAAAGTAPWIDALVTEPAFGALPKVLEGLPADRRFSPLKDYDGYFPFTPSTSREAWEVRAERVRRQIRVACGLWPAPTSGKLEAVVHGKVEREGYTVERVYIETFPGLYLTGSLYRPAGKTGPLPAVLCPHGHWKNGRFHDHGDAQLKKELASGAEKFEVGGRHPLQARCVGLARLGCVVFMYDMLGYADSPMSQQLVHGFAKQRPELSSPEKWGLFSAQSELRLINVFGLQTYNSIRALDWISALPGVDAKRIGVTGASGGGTQTMILAAIDSRTTAAFPAVMVSTAMQGGCTCENACYLRVDTGNIEFAALAAPRPQAMSAADDWTKELETKGLPELKKQYELLGAGDKVAGKYFPFPHNYNSVARTMMYEFFNQHLALGHNGPIVEQDYKPLTQEELTVWDAAHPKPASDEAAEVKLVQALALDSDKQLAALKPRDAASLKEYRRVVGGALDIMVGRGLPAASDIEYDKKHEADREDYKEYGSLLKLKPYGEEVPTVFLLPKNWNKQVVLYVSPEGKAKLFQEDGQPTSSVMALIRGGAAVASLDVFLTGEFTADGKPAAEWPKVKNNREFAGYTLGYNHPLFAQRVHDILTLLAFIRGHESKPERIALVGGGPAAAWVAVAAAQAAFGAGQPLVDKLALSGDFRFAGITQIRDPNLFPGALKYGDVPGFVALCAPTPLYLMAQGNKTPEVVTAAYAAAGAANKVTVPPAEADTLVKWLLT